MEKFSALLAFCKKKPPVKQRILIQKDDLYGASIFLCC